MKKIEIISASVRDGRLSHRGALFLDHFLRANDLAESHILDLKEYAFPLFHERYPMQKNPSPEVVDFASRVAAADGVIIVTPVYNASCAPALLNAVDLLVTEWARKPVAIYSGTYTPVPGIATVQEVQKLMLKLGALVTPALGTFINLLTNMDENGVPADPEPFVRIMRPPVDGLLWMIDQMGGK